MDHQNMPTVHSGTALVHPAAEKMPAGAKARGITPESWHVMTNVLFRGASPETICTLVDYCKARRLDPLKKPFHIVKVWDAESSRLVETIWASIGELRTTAMRTGEYAGKSEIIFGPDVTRKLGPREYTFPEWAQCTVFRVIKGMRVEFAGSRVYWIETYASKKDGSPNAMWEKRIRGQLAKTAEAEALRSAFPEEAGGDPTAEEMDGQSIGSEHARDITPPPAPAPARSAAPPSPQVSICDPYGEELQLLPHQMAQAVADWCRECTDEELESLLENNDNEALLVTVKAALLRRKEAAAAKLKLVPESHYEEHEEPPQATNGAAPSGEDPLHINHLGRKSFTNALELGLTNAKDGFTADRLMEIYRSKATKLGDDTVAKLDAIVAEKIEQSPGLPLPDDNGDPGYVPE